MTWVKVLTPTGLTVMCITGTERNKLFGWGYVKSTKESPAYRKDIVGVKKNEVQELPAFQGIGNRGDLVIDTYRSELEELTGIHIQTDSFCLVETVNDVFIQTSHLVYLDNIVNLPERKVKE